jgi:membrane associated rhomboid family serine protease
MKLQYNSPVILTFTLISTAVLAIDYVTAHFLITNFFTVSSSMSMWNPISYFRLFSHVFGHADWGHLLSNFSFILLIGPLLEEKYGSKIMIEMIFITALLTGIITLIFMNMTLLGASGIVFMLILLSSFANFKAGQIPVTFLLIVLLYIGKEVASSFAQDSISQFAHIFGGICGGIFGFIINKSGDEKKPLPEETSFFS